MAWPKTIQEPWQVLVAQAQQRLREMGGNEFYEVWLKPRLKGDPNEQELENKAGFLAQEMREDRPFAQPFYWAQFCVIGKGSRDA